MTTTQGPLTQWLLEATPQSLKRATTHPFLAAAGCGTVSKEKLSQWLSQDRLYAQSYIRFIGLLLAKIRIPENESMATMTTITAHSPGTSVEQGIIDVLIDALVNIRTELHFFKETAAEYGLDLTALPPREGYTDPESGADRAGSTNASASASASTAQSVPIATSAGILTTGPRSACPGFTGRVCQGTNVSVGGAESGEIEDDGGPVNVQSRDAQSQLHKLCKVQGECKAPPGAGPCHLASSTSTSQSPSWLSVGAGPAVTTPDCEPCQPSRSTTTEVSSEQGPVFFCANPITRAYIDMFMSVASPGVSAIEGITVLWATEICYLRAWRYAASYGRKKALETETETETSVQAARMDGSVDADGGALRDRFIPNWSSGEFEEFVNRIGRVLDQMVDSFKGAEEAEMIRARCLEWWRQVVWLEERFWPSME